MKTRILVLDDEKYVVDVIVTHLSGEGYECVGETDPADALEALKDRSISLLLTDLKMPEMHGIEVVQRAKDIAPDLAIVVLTGLGDVTTAIESMRAGADDYIVKPFNLAEIAVSVSRALDKRSLRIENQAYQESLENRVNEATQDLESVNRELRETKEYLESLLHSTFDAILSTDADNVVEFVNAGAERMFGYARDELMGASVAMLYQGAMNEVKYLRRKLDEGKPLQSYETMMKRKDGEPVPVNISLSAVRNEAGDIRAVLAICKDITDQKKLEAELKEMSIKDSLTGLYNQRHFYEALEEEIARSKRQKHPLSLLLFDIDQFKSYNDCHGHLEGDRVLQTAGKVVLECTRGYVDSGFRYGGDEFTVVLPEADEHQAFQIAERIRRTFEAQRFDELTLSIGLMEFREGLSLRALIRFTDAMMYDAKRNGGNQVCVYHEEAWAENDS